MNRWLDYKIYINNRLLTDKRITNACLEFKKEVLEKLPANEPIFIQLKIVRDDDAFRSITPVNVFLASQGDKVRDHFLEYWSHKSPDYFQYKLKYILISYKLPLVSAPSVKNTNLLSKKYIWVLL
jgi:hypothetical protein